MSIYVKVISPDGLVWVSRDNLTPKELSENGRHGNAVKAVLGNRDPWQILDFEGKTIGGVPLVAHPDDVEDLEDRGALDDPDFYMILPAS